MRKLLFFITAVTFFCFSCGKNDEEYVPREDVKETDFHIKFNNTFFNNKEGVEITTTTSKNDITIEFYSNGVQAEKKGDTFFFTSLPIGNNVITFSPKRSGVKLFEKKYDIIVVKDNSIKTIWESSTTEYINKPLGQNYLPFPTSWTKLVNQKMPNGETVTVNPRTLIEGMPGDYKFIFKSKTELSSITIDGRNWISGAYPNNPYPSSSDEYKSYFDKFYGRFKTNLNNIYNIDGFRVELRNSIVTIEKL